MISKTAVLGAGLLLSVGYSVYLTFAAIDQSISLDHCHREVRFAQSAEPVAAEIANYLASGGRQDLELLQAHLESLGYLAKIQSDGRLFAGRMAISETERGGRAALHVEPYRQGSGAAS